ncbi:hypothetical protein PDIG_52680 [Penicillium digitatum PHI26]|uniref:Uncharacterized protein n=1 Tax=Penicillium digitatum (strain PHI26 / CECT 20796) TaxID=1170229 RepID=K9FNC9_PEND2|nr:hypothetical protein PDIG_52680 [Penicillium digitatum PHI26]
MVELFFFLTFLDFSLSRPRKKKISHCGGVPSSISSHNPYLVYHLLPASNLGLQ